MRALYIPGILIVAIAMSACAAHSEKAGLAAFQFQRLDASAYAASASAVPGAAGLETAPWILPNGFTQRVVTDETRLNLYRDTACERLGEANLARGSDWPDMNTVNESGTDAGRYLYRTHEVRPLLYDANCRPNVPASEQGKKDFAAAGGGAISVTDLTTGETRSLLQRADFEALDGLVWTPWGTLLFAEEAIDSELADPALPNARSGLVYEATLDSNDARTVKSVNARPLLGALAHEGIEVDAEGNVYVVDEYSTGSIYRFVPQRRGDLSAGQLYALKIDDGKQTGAASWVALDMEQAQQRARDAAAAVGATKYCRPEDVERIASTLYVALTCEDVADAANQKGPGAVLSISLGERPKVSYFVGVGINANQENSAQRVTGFKNPDNLANGPDGQLWIVEDNVPSDIWVAEPDRNGDGVSDGLHLFASLQDPWAEGTGIYFSPDQKTLYVNVQHSRSGNDKTMAITRGDY